MENKDLTPEEIFSKYEAFIHSSIEIPGFLPKSAKEQIIKAMQEYAKQESRKAAEKAINGRVRRLGRCIR